MTFKNIPFGSLESFNVILEIPKDSPVKYEYNHEKDAIIQDFVFKDGFVFKYNYGFIPETLCGDGDPQDVMILNTKPLEQGKTYQCRAIGIIELLDRGEEDNKLLAVIINDSESNNITDISSLTEKDLQDFKDFYAEVARQKNKTMEILGFHDKERALSELSKAHQAFTA
ncbi:MAG: inorganic diphosphatase [Patescibacteria group bacterium]